MGLLPNSTQRGPAGSGFILQEIAGSLDFISVHVYPKTGHFEQDLINLKSFQIGKPLVIEETFPMNCKPLELRQFLTLSKADACGWMSFYWGQTPAELKRSKKPADALTREWLNVFRPMTGEH